MNKKMRLLLFLAGILLCLAGGWGKLSARAEEAYPWLDGIWLNEQTVEAAEPFLGQEPVRLTLQLKEMHILKVLLTSGEKEALVPLELQEKEDGWLAEAELLPEEGSWHFAILLEQEGGGEEMIYESPDLVADRTAPEVTLGMTEQEKEGERWLQMGIRVQEPYWDPRLAAIQLYRENPGEPAEKAEAKGTWQEVDAGVWEWQQEMREEGRWRLVFQTADLAGNLSKPASSEAILDRTPPRMTALSFTEDGEEKEKQEKMICRGKLEGRLVLEDRVSKVVKGEVWAQKAGQEKQLLQSWQGEQELAEISFSLEEEGEWMLWANAWDQEKNGREEILVGQVLLDGTCPQAMLSVSGTEGEHGFYTGEVKLLLTAEDALSGLERMNLLVDGVQAASFSGNGEQVWQACVEVPEEQDGIRLWTLQVWDLAGNCTETEKEIRLDKTPPQIELEAEAGACQTKGYYAAPRTIRIQVTEAFLEGACEVALYREDGLWKRVVCDAVGEDRYEAVVVAEEEGRYALRAVCTDLAGNRGETALEEVFVIDRTAPGITVSWEEPPEGGNRYEDIWYTRGPGNARICVEDDFPDEKGIVCVVEKDGVQTVQPLSFTGNKTKRQARLTLEEEGEYQVFLSATDLAGNQATPYTSGKFVLDRTPPELTFGKGDEADPLHRGEIAPWVRARDRYGKAQGMTVQLLCTGKGPGQSMQTDIPLQLPGAYRQEEGENSFSYLPWPRESQLDGCYCLEVRAEDLAGNVRQEDWTFTVNRFGSVFVFGEALLQAKQQYYVKEKPGLVIREYNPDRLVSRKILLENQEEIRVLKEGEDYTAEQTGREGQWNCYSYRVRPEVLKTDGSYRLSVHTTDLAGNAMDSRRQQELTFFLDREAPVIIVEPEKERRPGRQKLFIGMRDLSGVERAVFRIDGKQEAVYGKEEIREAGGRFALTVPLTEQSRQVLVEARDLAGNETVTEPVAIASLENTDTDQNTFRQEPAESRNRTLAVRDTGKLRKKGKFTAGFLLLFSAATLIIVQICVKNHKNKNRNC